MSLRCCCTPPAFYARKHDADSAFLNLATVDNTYTGNDIIKAGSNLYIWNGTASISGGTYPILKRYDLDLGSVFTLQTTYNSPNTTNCGAATVDSSGNMIITATRTVATNRHAVASYSSTGTQNWETNLDAPGAGGGVAILGITVDSGDNVYAVYVETGGATPGLKLTKFNSSGTKQWTTNVDATGGQPIPSLAVNSSDDIWCASVTNKKLYRVDSSGTVQLTKTFATSDILCVAPDGSTGVWTMQYDSVVTGKVARYDSSGSVVASWNDAEVPASYARNLSVDSSNNVIAIMNSVPVFPASALPRVRKWNSSGSVQWTVTSIGWTQLSPGPQAICTDGTYVWMAGDHKT